MHPLTSTQNWGKEDQEICGTTQVYLLFTELARLSVAGSFEQEAAGAALELDGDEENAQKKIKNIKRW